MPHENELPVAIRATPKQRRAFFGFGRRSFGYDALFVDGTVERQVNLDQVLQARMYPADAWATRDAAKAACPPAGRGPWVAYATGHVLSSDSS